MTCVKLTKIEVERNKTKKQTEIITSQHIEMNDVEIGDEELMISSPSTTSYEHNRQTSLLETISSIIMSDTFHQEDFETVKQLVESLVLTSNYSSVIYHAYELLCIACVKLSHVDILCSTAIDAIVSVDVDINEKSRLFSNIYRSISIEKYCTQLVTSVYGWLVSEIILLLKNNNMSVESALRLHNMIEFISNVQILLSHSLVRNNRSEELVPMIQFAKKMKMHVSAHHLYMCYLVLKPEYTQHLISEFDNILYRFNSDQKNEYAQLIVYHYILKSDWINLYKFLKRVLYGNGVIFPGAYESMLCCSIIQDMKLDPYLKLEAMNGSQCCKYLHMAYDLLNVDMFDRLILNCYPFIQCKFPFGTFSFSSLLEQSRQKMIDRIRSTAAAYVVRVKYIGCSLPVSLNDVICLGTVWERDTEKIYFYCASSQQMFIWNPHNQKCTSRILSIDADIDKGKLLVNPDNHNQLVQFLNNSAYLIDIQTMQKTALSGSGDVVLTSSDSILLIDQSTSEVYRFINNDFIMSYCYELPNSRRILNFCHMEKSHQIIALSTYEPDILYIIDIAERTTSHIQQKTFIPPHLLSGSLSIMQYATNHLFCTFAKESGFIGACMFSFSDNMWQEIRVVGDIVSSFVLYNDTVNLSSYNMPTFVLTRGKQIRKAIDSSNILSLKDGFSIVDICLSSNYEWRENSQKMKLFNILLQGQSSQSHTHFMDLEFCFMDDLIDVRY
jgi:hypothetical protein